MDQRTTERGALAETGRLKHYFDLARQQLDGPHIAARALHKRPMTRGSIARVRQFLRIDKGWTA